MKHEDDVYITGIRDPDIRLPYAVFHSPPATPEATRAVKAPTKWGLLRAFFFVPFIARWEISMGLVSFGPGYGAEGGEGEPLQLSDVNYDE